MSGYIDLPGTQAEIDAFIVTLNQKLIDLAADSNAIYVEAYQLLINYLSVDGLGEERLPTTPVQVWRFLNAAITVNAGGSTGISIAARVYSAKQVEIRTGGDVTDKDMQDASNNIALSIMNDVVTSGQMPDIDRIALHDAAAASTIIFDGEEYGWVGNPLFIPFGHRASWDKNIIAEDLGTYEILAAAVSFKYTLGSFGSVPEALYQFFEMISVASESNEGLGNFLSLASSVAVDTDAALMAAYKNPNITLGVLRGMIQGNIILGKTSDDAALAGTEESEMIHAGRGDDTILASDGGDLIDGGKGTDVLDYSSHDGEINFHITMEEKTSAVTWTGRAFKKYSSKADSFYNIEDIRGSQKDDLFWLEKLTGDLTVDGGSEEDLDTLSIFNNEHSGEFDAVSGQLRVGGNTVDFSDFEAFEGSDHNDIFRLNEEILKVDGRAGDDEIYADSDEVSQELKGWSGADKFYVGKDDVILDPENEDETFWKGEAIPEGFREEGSNGPWYSEDGRFKFEMTGGIFGFFRDTLLVTVDGTHTFTVEDFDRDSANASIILSEKRPEPDFASPLVFDLDGDGIELTAKGYTYAYFDMDQDGFRERTGWVAPDDGLLAADWNGDGQIVGLGELFGTGFIDPQSSTAQIPRENGFVTLADHDENEDGQITAADSVWSQLLIWQDANSDGISDAGELTSISDLGITAINLDWQSSNEEQAGNLIKQVSDFTWSDGTSGTVADVWFQYSPQVTEYDAPVVSEEQAAEIALLPNLARSGEVMSLRDAMAADPLLKEMVEELASLDVSEAYLIAEKTEAIIYRWTGVDDLDVNVSDTWSFFTHMDPKRMEALDRLRGFDLKQFNGTVDGAGPNAGSVLAASWRQLHSEVTAALLAQIDLGTTLAPGLAYVATANFELGNDQTLDGILSAMVSHIPAGTSEQIQYWNSMSLVIKSLEDVVPESETQTGVLFDQYVGSTSYGITYSQFESSFIGTSGDDRIVGVGHDGREGLRVRLDNENVIMGGPGNDQLRGNGGADTYLFGRGSGHDKIYEVGNISMLKYGDTDNHGLGDTVKFLPGITPDDLQFLPSEDSEFDLLVRIKDTGETLTISFQLMPDVRIVDKFEFADGTVLNWNEIDIVGPTIGTDGGDYLWTYSDAGETFNGGTGDDTIRGGSGGDTYVFDSGFGDDVLIVRSASLGGSDTIQFTAGLDPSDFDLSRSEDGDRVDLILTNTATGDRLTVDDFFAEGASGVSQVTFADGTVWTWQGIVDQFLAGTSGDDLIEGTGVADTINGGAGSDLLQGFAGDDTYEFGRGSGDDRVIDDRGVNLLRLTDIAQLTELNLSLSAKGDLIVEIADTGETLTLQNFKDGLNGFNLELSGGDTFSRLDILGQVVEPDLQGGDHSEMIWSDGNSLIDPGSGTDWIVLRHGDNMMFGEGSGRKLLSILLSNSTSEVARISLAPGITPDDIHIKFSMAPTGYEPHVIVYDVWFDGIDDSLTLYTDDILFNTPSTILFEFADGTVWNETDLVNRLYEDAAAQGIRYHFGGQAGDTFDLAPGSEDHIVGNYTIYADSGWDIYVFERGGGNDVVYEQNINNYLQFGNGLSMADLQIEFGPGWSGSIGDTDTESLRITIKDTGDTIYTVNARVFSYYFVFQDDIDDGGTTVYYSLEAFIQDWAAQAGTSGDDLIFGSKDNDVLDGGIGADTYHDRGGDDIYRYDLGDGADTINDKLGNDTIEFGGGITPADVSASYDGYDLILTVGNSADQIRIVAGLDRENNSGIQSFVFSDGTVWSLEDVVADFALSTDGFHIGTAGDDVLTGGPGADLLEGFTGSDTYNFSRGDGADEINEAGGATDRVVFAPDIAPNDIRYALHEDGERIILSIQGTADQITVDAGIENFEFSDGTVLTSSDVYTSAIASNSTAHDDLVVGTVNGEILSGGAGNDTLAGGRGFDTYLFNIGDGHDVIDEDRVLSEELGLYYTPENKVIFGSGIDPADIAFSLNNQKSITLTVVSTGDSLTVPLIADNNIDPKLMPVVQTFEFADGTVWDWNADIIPMLQADPQFSTGTAGDDVILDFSATHDGGPGNDFLFGGIGADTYVFAVGYGDDTIREEFENNVFIAPETFDEPDTLVLSGLILSDVEFFRGGDDLNDLIIQIVATGETLTIEDQFGWVDGMDYRPTFRDGHYLPIRTLADGSTDISGIEGPIGLDQMAIGWIWETFHGSESFVGEGVEKFHFADGTVLTKNDLNKMDMGTRIVGDNNLSTDDRGGVLDGGDGNDTLMGGSGRDTYIFDSGYGEDVISDAGGYDTIKFGAEIELDHMVFTRIGNDLLIEIPGAVRLSLTIIGQFTEDGRIEEFDFGANGKLTWDAVQQLILINSATLLDDTITGFDTDDKIYGLDGDDTLAGGIGDDVIRGGSGRDTAVFSGSPDDYEITQDGDRTVVRDLRPDGDGTDTLISVEDLYFEGADAGAGEDPEVHLVPENQAPVAGDDAAVTDEDTAIEILASDILGNDSDPDGTALSLSTIGAVTGGAAWINLSGNISFVPDADFSGTAMIPYTIIDPDGAEASAAITVTVTAVNDAPVTSNLSLETDEDVSVDGVISATDTEGDTLTYTLASEPASGSVTLEENTGAFTYTPAADVHGAISFVVSVQDETGAEALATVLIDIDSQNDNPVNEPDIALGVDEDSSILITQADLLANASDVDGDQISADFLGTSSGELYDNQDGTWTFTPAPNFNGVVDLDYWILDGAGGATPVSGTVAVVAINALPEVSEPITASGDEDTTIILSQEDLLANATDIDGDQLTAQNLLVDSGIVTENGDGSWSFTPDANFYGSVNLTFDVTDGIGDPISATGEITVESVNDTPEASDAVHIYDGATAISGTVQASDVDGDTLGYTVTLQPVSGTVALDELTGEYTYTPADAGFVNDVFTVEVSDGNGGVATSDIAITGETNRPPNAVSDLLSTAFETALTYDVTQNDIDLDGDILTVTAVTDGENGTVVLNLDGTVTYMPENGYYGADSFTYTISDGNGEIAVGTVEVAVDPLPGVGGSGEMVGTPYSDVLFGGKENDEISGLSGADWLFGGAGNDYLAGNRNDDRLYGEAGDDDLFGNQGNDTIFGGSGDDFLQGGADDDALYGGSGDDNLNGHKGDDLLLGGAGTDTLRGGNGQDTFGFGRNLGSDTILDHSGAGQGDRIAFEADVTYDNLWFEQSGNDLVISVLGTDTRITVIDHFKKADDLLIDVATSGGIFSGIVDAAALVALMGAYGPAPAGTEVPALLMEDVDAAWGLVGQVTPVVFDLAGNGIALAEAEVSGVAFDVDGDGTTEMVGWPIGADDAILALDRDGDGAITTGLEISFTSDLPGARTDLEGLKAFDSNGDNLLDAGDAGFGDFLLWRDANLDGISQDGELSTLEDFGIASIDLTITATGDSPGPAPDNAIVNTAAFTWADGATGTVGDVILGFKHSHTGDSSSLPSSHELPPLAGLGDLRSLIQDYMQAFRFEFGLGGYGAGYRSRGLGFRPYRFAELNIDFASGPIQHLIAAHRDQFGDYALAAQPQSAVEPVPAFGVDLSHVSAKVDMDAWMDRIPEIPRGIENDLPVYRSDLASADVASLVNAMAAFRPDYGAMQTIEDKFGQFEEGRPILGVGIANFRVTD